VSRCASSIVVAVLLGSCGKPARSPRKPEPEAPESKASISSGVPITSTVSAPPAGFATADLVLTVGGELSTWTITGDKLVRTGVVTLAKVDPEEIIGSRLMQVGLGDWADREHLFVSVGARDVVMVTASAITAVPIPPVSTFETPRPTSPDAAELERGNDNSMNNGGLVVRSGETWWQECPWGLPYDGFQCSGWIRARLWPTPNVMKEQAELTRIEHPWPSASPKKLSARLQNANKVLCSTGVGKPNQLAPDDLAEEIMSVHWVSAEPPRMLVIYGHAGLADTVADRWTLHDGCEMTPIAAGTDVTPGPNGLWLAEDEHGVVLYRGAVRVGQLPAHTDVMLRPSR
jgi:hypothetical protein